MHDFFCSFLGIIGGQHIHRRSFIPLSLLPLFSVAFTAPWWPPLFPPLIPLPSLYLRS